MRFINIQQKSVRTASAALFAAIVLTGCSTLEPKPFTQQEVLDSSQAAAAKAAADVEPLTVSLTLEEAIARGLKYNLDQRVRMMEQAYAMNYFEAGKFDMLPRVIGSAGYRHRSEELITRSRRFDLATGNLGPFTGSDPFVNSDREAILYDLGSSWSVLDLALGYYNAKQNSDRILVAGENRRKAMHELNRDVTIAYWRMASAQRLRGDVQATLREAEAAVADSARAGSEGLQSPVDQLRYQRQILENIRLLSTIEKDFSTARVTLANLINLPLSQDFTVTEPTDAASEAALNTPVEQMEEMALLRNAELKGSMYEQRIAAQEVRKAWAKALPNLNLSYNLRKSTDDFLINDHWSEAAATLSQNLTNLIALPSNRRTALSGVDLAEQKRIAKQMAVLAQVHIARINLAGQYKNLQLADRIWNIDEQIKRQATNQEQAQAASKLTRVSASAAAIVSQLRRYQALADYHAAAGALQSTLGLELDLDSVQDQSVADLSSAIRSWMDDWNAGNLQSQITLDAAPAADAPVAAAVAEMPATAAL
jgi:outer membrane protein TolC